MSSPPRLTARAAGLGLVVCGLVVSSGPPLREYLTQRGEIHRLEAAQREQRERLAELQAQRRRLQDPAYITALARDRLHYVLPGETAYVVLGAPSPAPTSPAARSATRERESPWYSQLWGSVRTADQPAPSQRPARGPASR
ncbi:MAG TPA: septum formation initiator family protein [Mycobacteriales bacterium]|nr:septum formation initiator family protein [Mycobacteriales bacterium]